MNKESFLDYFRECTMMEKLLCEKYSMINIGKEIYKLPDKKMMGIREF